ncbi:MAG: hypothetical protein ACK5YR_13295 [Pirellula sp.]|jgi:hypothetical protein
MVLMILMQPLEQLDINTSVAIPDFKKLRQRDSYGVSDLETRISLGATVKALGKIEKFAIP